MNRKREVASHLDALAQHIAQNTTLGVGDIFGVLKSLEEAIINALTDGMKETLTTRL